MPFKSGKIYTHEVGLSCTFRQWRAEDTHCRFLHGYALQVEVEFEATDGLDHRNWVVNFGGLKPFKAWLEQTFDHKTLVAHDDPKREFLEGLDELGLAQVVIVTHTGCEAFARMIFEWLAEWIFHHEGGRVCVKQVTVREHGSNYATYYED